MLLSLSIIIIIEFIIVYLSSKIKFTKIIGYLFAGIIVGPYLLNLLDIKLLNISAEIRQMALIIILIKAGLTLSIKDLKAIGIPAILMSFLPATFEIFAYYFFAPIILKISKIDALLMGSVMSAVSPAVVVPRMVDLIEKNIGTNKKIPQLILAGASCDDIYVIVLFSSFLTAASGSNLNLKSIINIPVSIVSGILIGAIFGIIISYVFKKYINSKNNYLTAAILCFSFLLMALEKYISIYFAMSGLLAIISMNLLLKENMHEHIISNAASNYGAVWIVAQIFLFVLVGAEVNVQTALNFGLKPVIMIFIALVFRSIGVIVSLTQIKLNAKEKLFTVLAYLPKATVQAAIGSVPLSMGLKSGQIILTTAVLGILITAPLGAICIDKLNTKLLK